MFCWCSHQQNLQTGCFYYLQLYFCCLSVDMPCEDGVFYVGRAKRRLRDCLAEHKYAIRTRDHDYPIARHFSELHNANDSLLPIRGVEHIEPLARGSDRIQKLSWRETFWIHQLDALKHPGLSEDIDFTCFVWIHFFYLFCLVKWVLPWFIRLSFWMGVLILFVADYIECFVLFYALVILHSYFFPHILNWPPFCVILCMCLISLTETSWSSPVACF